MRPQAKNSKRQKNLGHRKNLQNCRMWHPKHTKNYPKINNPNKKEEKMVDEGEGNNRKSEEINLSRSQQKPTKKINYIISF